MCICTCVCRHSNKICALVRFGFGYVQWLAFFPPNINMLFSSMRTPNMKTTYHFSSLSTTCKSTRCYTRNWLLYNFVSICFLFLLHIFFPLNKCKMLSVLPNTTVYSVFTTYIRLHPIHPHYHDYLMHCFNQIVFLIATIVLKQCDDIGMKISIFRNVL